MALSGVVHSDPHTAAIAGVALPLQCKPARCNNPSPACMTAEPQPAPAAPGHPQPLLPDLSDTATAFRYKSDGDLRRSHLLYKSIQSNLLVRSGPPLVEFALRLGLPIDGLLRDFFFRQFCGGETLPQTLPRADALAQFGVHTILDYAVEAEKTEAGFDAATHELLRALDAAANRADIPFTAMKLTGIGSFDLLAKRSAGTALHGSEHIRYERMEARLDQLCGAAYRTGQGLLLDAEESWIQPEIDRLAEAMMRKYNRTRPTLYTTTQLYRHDRLAYLQHLLPQAKTEGWILAVKAVRGAYLEKENARARVHNYPTPMQPNKAATDRDFDAACTLLLNNLDHAALVAGTHNEQSCLHIVAHLQRLGLPRNDSRVYFAQLFGMSDHISFNLAAAGCNVAKYLPYGPLRAVLPYLFRRAQENTSIAGQSSRELKLVEAELRRRRQAKRLKPA